MGMAWGVGYTLSKENWYSVKRETKDFHLLFSLCFAMAWLGAKLFFLFFSATDKMSDYAKEVNFWLGGGFVFYGGLIFGALSLVIGQFLIKDFKLKETALFVPPLYLSHGIGRVGCFLAGCCFGGQCSLPHIEKHPVQLYEVFGLVLLYLYSNRKLKDRDFKSTLMSYLLGYSALRFILEFFRDDSIRGHFYGLSTSQWISLFLLFCGLSYFLFFRRFKRNTF